MGDRIRETRLGSRGPEQFRGLHVDLSRMAKRLAKPCAFGKDALGRGRAFGVSAPACTIRTPQANGHAALANGDCAPVGHQHGSSTAMCYPGVISGAPA